MTKVNRAWGYYEENESGQGWKIKTLVVFPNRCLSYQVHEHRNEIWLVKEGYGTAIIGETVYRLTTGGTYFINQNEWHQLINGTNENLVMHEIQHGTKCEEEDIQRL